MLRPLQLVVFQILDKAVEYEWTMQGFGLLRMYIKDKARLHIWDDRLEYPNVSKIHNHSWDLKSTIISGRLFNIQYQKVDDSLNKPTHWHSRFVCGLNTKQLAEPEAVILKRGFSERYEPGQTYSQKAEEIHLTEADRGTITLMERQLDGAFGEADLFWSIDKEWGTAKPEIADKETIHKCCGFAMKRLEKEIGSAGL